MTAKKVTAVKKPAKKGITIVEPLNVEVIKPPVKEKREMPSQVFPKAIIITKVPLPEGYIRAEVLKDYKGMEDDLYCGDIVDLPERRFKSLSMRGLVMEYKGESQPNKRR